MNFDFIVSNLKKDYIEKKVIHTEFVDFMEQVNDPYLVLICCILSLRTNDKITFGASQRMLKLGRTPMEILKLDIEELSRAIYPVGFYRNKAKQIIELSQEIVSKYESKIPKTIEELIKFKGVGRKTANLVLAKGHNIPALCVDVHVHRICNRIGFLNTKIPDETEMQLRNILPKKHWKDFNTLLVTHGQNICKPRKPLCDKCSISAYCNKNI